MKPVEIAEIATNAVTLPGEVTVLLSTFNGSAFLRQQLDSLYSQTYPNIRILARDDGSSDTTPRILELERSAGRIELLGNNTNLGAAQSFFTLLQHAAATDTDFVAFCDQDDVWLPEKLACAVSALSAIPNERAAMYCSRLEIVEADLRHLGVTPAPRQIGFGNALVESITIGCSLVLNRKALELVSRNLPNKVLIHDWWCYLVLSCFGEIVFDDRAPVKYRQHGNNAFGAASGTLNRLGRNLRRFGWGDGRHWQSEQAAFFMTTFGDSIPPLQRGILDQFVEARSSWPQRLKLALTKDIWRQKPMDDLLMRLLILLNRF